MVPDLLIKQTIQNTGRTPYEDVISRFGIAIGCGYKKCKAAGVVFGLMPIAGIHGLSAVRNWEAKLNAHEKACGHRRRKLIEMD